jgi:flagella basal body P-ring formation protein FlgA
VVSARDLLPGEVVTEKDVKLVPRRINNLRDLAFSDTQMVLGQEIARSLPSETVIRSSMIRKLILVKRNQNVALRSQVGQVQISVEGTALDNGAGGDLVQVRYGNKNKTVVRGRVTGPGFVVVTDEIPDEAVEVTAAAAAKPYPESQTVPRKNNDRQD